MEQIDKMSVLLEANCGMICALQKFQCEKSKNKKKNPESETTITKTIKVNVILVGCRRIFKPKYAFVEDINGE